MKELESLDSVGEATSLKLKNAGYDTFDKIAKAKIEDLSSKIKVNNEIAIKIIESAKKKLKENDNEDDGDQKDPIILENFKIKKGIPNHIYNGFKVHLKAKDDSKFEYKELESKYKEFLNKEI